MATADVTAKAAQAGGPGSRAYELRAVPLLALTFGLVALSRWILPPLFSAGMGKELGLGPAHLGLLVGAIGLCWGFSALFFGGISDLVGRRRVLVPTVVAFSVLSVFTGLASGLILLVLIRGVMGVAEGLVAPTGMAGVIDASPPKRRGVNTGIFQCASALMGLALAPILATQLIGVLDWRMVFILVGLPGLVVAVLLALVLREPQAPVVEAQAEAPAKFNWLKVFKQPNIALAMAGLFCAMAAIFVLSAMAPGYLIQSLRLTPAQMGIVISAVGFGGAAGQFLVPAISDVTGRRLASAVAFAFSAACLFGFLQTGANIPLLFGLLFFAAAGTAGVLAVIAGPLAAESAPAGMIAATTGMIIGAGEIFGGGVAPAVAGFLAEAYGPQAPLYLALGALLVGTPVAACFRETAPQRAARREGKA